jgi:hypothetical protein
MFGTMGVDFDFKDIEERKTILFELLIVQGILAAKQIAASWDKKSFRYVPEEDHLLAYSFASIVEVYGMIVQMAGWYDAAAENGFHYAAYQFTEDLNHFGPEKQFIKPDAMSHYMEYGMIDTPDMAIWQRYSNIAIKTAGL